MSALDRARELGAEHGRRDAEVWWDGLDDDPERNRVRLGLPDPCYKTMPQPLGSIPTVDMVAMGDDDWNAYADAYRAARDATIRARSGEAAR